MRLVTAGVLLGLTACGSHGGGDGGGGDCVSHATPPNLVGNAGFECGVTAWFARDGQLEPATEGHSGQASAKLTVPAAGTATLTTEQPVMPLRAVSYCATVWVKGTAPAAVFTLRKVKAGGVEDFTFTDTVSATAWARLPPTLKLDFDGTDATQVLVLVQTRNALAGDTLLVDDLDLWESASGRCDEAR